MPTANLDSSALPPFKPTKKVVQCVNNNQMSALMWAFSSCVPPVTRILFAGVGRASNESLKVNHTPAMQWNYSMFHIAHHYDNKFTKFVVTDEEDTASILLEITALKACPKDVSAQPQSAFLDPQSKEPLGALPIFFVRYFYEEKGKSPSWKPAKESVKFINNAINKDGGLMKVIAASIEEIKFAHQELQCGQSLLGKATKSGKFNESVLFPKPVTTKSPGKALVVCSSCDAIITTRPVQMCARCKTTCYCNRDCQTTHWKTGGHKKVCGKKILNEGQRKSFTFDMDDAKPHHPEGLAHLTMSHLTGNMNITGVSKEERSKLKHKGHKVSKAPTSKNVYGNREFIVKLQPPAGIGLPGGLPTGDWMCYDGPTRSFQAFIPDATAGLPEVYELLQREGVKSINPLCGLFGYKGYFCAKWEGGSVRIFYDKLASPQMW